MMITSRINSLKDTSTAPRATGAKAVALQSAWGPATIVTTRGPVDPLIAAAKSKLSLAWQDVLDRLLANPKSKDRVKQNFDTSLVTYTKNLNQVYQSSSAGSAASMKRKDAEMRIKLIKNRLTIAKQLNVKISQGEVKALINELKSIAAQLNTPDSDSTPIALLPNFDGASAANDAVLPSSANSTAPNSSVQNGSTQSPDTQANTVVDDAEAELGSTQTLSGDEKQAIIGLVSDMQARTDASADHKQTMADEESKGDREADELRKDVERLVQELKDIDKRSKAKPKNDVETLADPLPSAVFHSESAKYYVPTPVNILA